MWRPPLILSIVACLASAAGAGYYMHLRGVAAVKAEEHPEGVALRDKYGPERNSYAYEELIIRDYFNDKRDGVFVDVGANDYRFTSNTYYLETALHWSGLAIEPLQQFEADYKLHRPRTKFLPFFIADVSNERARMYVLEKNTLVSSADPAFTAAKGADAKQVDVPTITLNDLLDTEGLKTFDFLSMDIELWEPKALAGFDIERFRPQLVCIEAHLEVRQQILDYFARHGYVLVGKYVRADLNNLYFAPLK